MCAALASRARSINTAGCAIARVCCVALTLEAATMYRSSADAAEQMALKLVAQHVLCLWLGR